MTNFTTNAGSGGSTFASDTISTVEYPLAKSAWGAAGAVNQTAMAAALPVQPGTGATWTIQGVQDTSTSGSITTNASVIGPLSVTQRNVVTVSVSGTYAGVTFVIEASDDSGTTWFPLQCINNATGQAGATWTPGTNALASYDSAIGGYTSMRVRATAWTSGSATVRMTAQSFAYDPVVAAISQGLAANGTVPVGNPVFVAGFDGTNVRQILVDTSGRPQMVGAAASAAAVAGNPVLNGFTFTTTLPTVTTGQVVNAQSTARGEQLVALSNGAVAVAHKAASTAAVATDPALVVAVSPNNVLKVGDGTTAAVTTAASTAAAAASAAMTVALSPNSGLAPTTSALHACSTAIQAALTVANVKASAGSVYGMSIANLSAATLYIQFYNTAGTPTLGTSVIWFVAVPASGTLTIPASALALANFATGIGIGASTTATSTGTPTTAPAVTIFYK